ncbi:putative radical SAM protein YgiQ [Anaerosolibacter carboniphilus]|uniref:Putative radical SAM protein YgiQ n=1 Tax=Anaerosolibacter carboniphilus TaxID=1417629 RepID=A0A841KQE4_9FIRM|nr:YgiQ family radical SAM protein [Anaerosolibacter carboniphilus]MBB6215647.1 putative radical SAM protein YgiQ [Anaerosolibacter carboniphilus]
MNRQAFLPIDKEDMNIRGWTQLDFIIVSGDAYVDHPSFGTAVIARVLEDAGYKVGIIPQPDWRSVKDFKKLGKPRLAFLIASGNIDSMVNHYTVSKRRRDKDYYSPGGKMGLRPDRATIVYCNMVKQAYKGVPIIIGGIEASLRRFAHYDYWNDKVRRSILFDSEADLLVFGMGERQIIEIADNLNNGFDIKYMHHIPGTSYKADTLENIYDYIEIPSFEEVSENKVAYARAFKVQYEEQDPFRGKVMIQKHGEQYIVQNSPAMPLSRVELDRIYNLPYARDYHPIYEKEGGIPAIEEVKYSIISSRGCFGSCSFCALTFHQGRTIQSRSHESIIDEAKKIVEDKDFKGYIHDVGGPTANFRQIACEKQLKEGTCKNKQCLFPNPCKNLNVDHEEYIQLLRKLRKLEGIKKVFVRSGLRYDYIVADKNDNFLKELCEHHVSGQLKVAPEHISSKVLDLMGKPRRDVYEKFVSKYYKLNEKLGKNQYLVPYLMSSHPGSDLHAAIEMAEYLRDIKYNPEQVQDFYPTPGTLSTCMYYTGLDPRNMKPVYVPKDRMEKAMQRALLQYRNPKNYNLVRDALLLAGREDLIGYGPKALIKPKDGERSKEYKKKKNNMRETKGNRLERKDNKKAPSRKHTKKRK